MTEPTVCAILITCDRIEMARRAVDSFRSQTYANKRLLIYNTGERLTLDGDCSQIMCHWADPGPTVGELRNAAIKLAVKLTTVASLEKVGVTWFTEGPDIIAHMDDDDYSSPQRLAEQVALLQASDADAVGYSDLLFWDTRYRDTTAHSEISPTYVEGKGQAWLYTRPSKTCVPGTSLCYWRKTWDYRPFPHLPERGNPQSIGEDVVWQAGLKVVAVSSMSVRGHFACTPETECDLSVEPRMIASVHSGNTMAFGYSHIGSLEEYRRVECWDSYCAERMKL